MPLERQTAAQAAPVPRGAENLVIRSLAVGLPSGTRLEEHAHPWPQLVYATRGVLTVRTDEGTWVIPSHRAAWVPAGLAHSLEATGKVKLRTLYLRPNVAEALPLGATVMDVSPLLRELVLETVRHGTLDESVPHQARLAGVLVDQLVETPEVPLDLALPNDPRARGVAERLLAEPAAETTLADLAAGSGASLRTLERLFLRETGQTLGAWRQRARVLHALRRLASGASVTEAALDVGYASTSAFIAMFKRTVGKTPGEMLP